MDQQKSAVISKLQWLLEEQRTGDSSSDVQRDIRIGKAYCHHAADRIERRLGSLFDNRDEQTIEIADLMLEGREANTGSNGRH